MSFVQVDERSVGGFAFTLAIIIVCVHFNNIDIISEVQHLVMFDVT